MARALVGDDKQRAQDRLREERLFAVRAVAQGLDRSLLDLERHFDDETNLPDP
jgi:hypothetical protein